MKTFSYRIALTIFILCAACSCFAQPFTKQQKEILMLQDKRTIGKNNELIKYLKSGKTDVTNMSAIALANIADSTTVDALGEQLLHEPVSSYVNYNSAFALGEIGTQKCGDYLAKALGKFINRDDKLTRELVCEILNNLSKTGSENELNIVTSLQTNDDVIKPYLALCIARFGMRRIKNESSFSKLAELMRNSTDTELLRNISYAFYRIGDKNFLTPYKSQIGELALSLDAYIRMWAFGAIGKIQDSTTAESMLNELNIEAEWQVRVNICNALANQQLSSGSPLLEKITVSLLQHGLSDNSDHVAITALTGLAKLYSAGAPASPFAESIKENLKTIINAEQNSVHLQVKTEAVKTYAKLFKDDAKDDLFNWFSAAENYDMKSSIVSSFAFMEDAMVYKVLRDTISNDVMRYNEKNPNKDGSMIGSPDLAKMYKGFVEALAGLDDRLDDENKNNIRLIFSEFAASKNAVITDLCLTNLMDSMYMEYRGETCRIMMFDYPGFSYPKDKDVMLLYIMAWDNMKYEEAKEILNSNLKHSDFDIAKASADALKNITGKDYTGQITAKKYSTDFDWDYIDNLNEKNIAILKTNKGDIKIELFPFASPFTVQNFVKLGERGFFNNTVFHRVVPNFVIQGGDPTGTGYGGPIHSIRSEFTPITYDSYTVGMASSVKDTEGSQFFITHSPQPHLDGKYTVFGKVIDGFESVDRIQQGDIIESVTFTSQ